MGTRRRNPTKRSCMAHICKSKESNKAPPPNIHVQVVSRAPSNWNGNEKVETKNTCQMPSLPTRTRRSTTYDYLHIPSGHRFLGNTYQRTGELDGTKRYRHGPANIYHRRAHIVATRSLRQRDTNYILPTTQTTSFYTSTKAGMVRIHLRPYPPSINRITTTPLFKQSQKKNWSILGFTTHTTQLAITLRPLDITQQHPPSTNNRR